MWRDTPESVSEGLHSPLRSCPERPGPQVVLCLGMRSEVRNGVCLWSSRYARSSRWAELVAVVACGTEKGKQQDISEEENRGKKQQHTNASMPVNKLIVCTHTKERGKGFRESGPRLKLPQERWSCCFSPQIPSSPCLSRSTEADAMRPLSGLISLADKCLIYGAGAVWRRLMIVSHQHCVSEADTQNRWMLNETSGREQPASSSHLSCTVHSEVWKHETGAITCREH